MTSMHSVSFAEARPAPIHESTAPRYAEPDIAETGPREGQCYNCDHMVAITLDGKTYKLCAQERDDNRSGEVYECDPDLTECADWDWNGYEL